MTEYHLPIMPAEVVSLLKCRPGGIYVDCTLGGGGHAAEILKASSPDGRLIGIDRDGEAIRESGKALEIYSPRVVLVRSNFRAIGDILDGEGLPEVDGILADLGVSSRQLDAAERGFSFMKSGPLDMRMDQSSGETASELIERLSAAELENIIRRFGEERRARAIARAIKNSGKIETTLELAEVVAYAVPKRLHPKKTHVATRTFQALRIAVNDELSGLDRFIEEAASYLRSGGRIAIISFHSLEDRVVKRTFRELAKDCICPPDLPLCRCDKEAVLRVVTNSAVVPSGDEEKLNPRSRSARLRVAERL